MVCPVQCNFLLECVITPFKIDNILINTTKYNFTIYPMINGMSDHDAQIIILYDITMVNDSSHFYFTRKLNETSVLDFNLKLSYESWEDVFSHDDIHLNFNNFLNIYLRIFYSSFTTKKFRYSSQTKACLTKE